MGDLRLTHISSDITLGYFTFFIGHNICKNFLPENYLTGQKFEQDVGKAFIRIPKRLSID